MEEADATYFGFDIQSTKAFLNTLKLVWLNAGNLVNKCYYSLNMSVCNSNASTCIPVC